MRGRLITFEGVEGGGKSIQTSMLAQKLREAGFEVLTTREPGGTPTGEIIRDILQNDKSGEPISPAAEALLFCASRAQLCQYILKPALERGAWIVLDRFTDPTLAYQGYGRGFDVETLRKLNDFATGSVKPDLTFLIDIPVELGLSRVFSRECGTGDRMEREPIEFHQRLYAGYREMASRETERIKVVDGQKQQFELADEIWAEVRTRLMNG
ncbi:MAG: dTMP kinase [Lentisphaerae bacterium]|nr:dTMP kinase [Lentisphaerota bacterium]